MRKVLLLVAIIGIGIISFFSLKVFQNKSSSPAEKVAVVPTITPLPGELGGLSIEAMRKKMYPGSQITIEQTLPSGRNYYQYLTSYISEGKKIYALLTIPMGAKPKNGWPVILLNHGYIPPSQYNTVSSYALPTDALASAGFIVFKPDYRGNGNSEGTPAQVYISPAYTTDSMNALSSIAKYQDANPQKIGVWGHSMGGNVTLRELVITHKFQAAVLWSGVVGNWSQILSWWKSRIAQRSVMGNDQQTADVIEQMLSKVGTPQTNSSLWNQLDPTLYLSFISTPIQIDVGTEDTTVPPSFSTDLATKLNQAGKSVELFTYPGADHNLSPESGLAMQRAIDFFNKYLK